MLNAHRSSSARSDAPCTVAISFTHCLPRPLWRIQQWHPFSCSPVSSARDRRSRSLASARRRAAAHGGLLAFHVVDVQQRRGAGIQHVGLGAEPRSARRPQGRSHGRAGSDVESPRGLAHASRRRSSSASRTPISPSPGPYAIQGSYNGYQIWDISNPAQPTLKTAYYCPASQSDVSVYKNLLFVSGEGTHRTPRLRRRGREGHGEQGSPARPAHLRHHATSRIRRTSATCRRAAARTRTRCWSTRRTRTTSTSTSRARRAFARRASCRDASSATPDQDPNSALFRIEVIKVPLAHPEQAAIVSSPRIFNDLIAPARHGEAQDDIAENAKAVADAKAKGGFIATIRGREQVLRPRIVKPLLDSVVKARGGTGAPTAADSAALRAAIPGIIATMIGPSAGESERRSDAVPRHHRVSGDRPRGRRVRGLRLAARHSRSRAPDAHRRRRPIRTSRTGTRRRSTTTARRCSSAMSGAAAASRSAARPTSTSGAPTRSSRSSTARCSSRATTRCRRRRRSSRTAWRTTARWCRFPGRDVMIQSWYQGGISLFDWTDIAHPKEIAFFDRGPVDSTRMASGGSWSVYWYNGVMVSSEISRGLDIVELTPSAFISQNEIDAAKTVKWDYLNTQGQRKIVWPPSFALAGAYLDQLERSHGLAADKIAADRAALKSAEKASGSARQHGAHAAGARSSTATRAARATRAKVQKLSESVKALAPVRSSRLSQRTSPDYRWRPCDRPALSRTVIVRGGAGRFSFEAHSCRTRRDQGRISLWHIVFSSLAAGRLLVVAPSSRRRARTRRRRCPAAR